MGLDPRQAGPRGDGPGHRFRMTARRGQGASMSQPLHSSAHRLLLLCSMATLLGACSTPTPVSTVPGPRTATPLVAPLNIERANTGSLFYNDTATAEIYTDRRKPRAVG